MQFVLRHFISYQMSFGNIGCVALWTGKLINSGVLYNECNRYAVFKEESIHVTLCEYPTLMRSNCCYLGIIRKFSRIAIQI